jgi:hypothetical protein
MELPDANKKAIDDLLIKIEDLYGIEPTRQIGFIEDKDMTEIIYMISDILGYEEGKLWVKTRSANPDLDFSYEYIMEKNNTIIKVNGRVLPKEELEIMDNIIYGGNIAVEAKNQNNASIKRRGVSYEKITKKEIKKQAVGKNIDNARDVIMNSIASSVPTEMQLMIPCTCDNFLCMLLNTIIQYVFGALNKLLSELIAMIAQFLIPDWAKDLIRLIQEFLACLGSIFGIALTIADIHSHAEMLLEAMRDRIRYYPADACFIPEDPFSLPPDDIPGDYLPGEPIDGEDWGDFGDGDVYYPPINNDTDVDRSIGDLIPGAPVTDDNVDKNAGGLPVIIHPDVEVIPGIQGKKYPGFKIVCDYLVI